MKNKFIVSFFLLANFFILAKAENKYLDLHGATESLEKNLPATVKKINEHTFTIKWKKGISTFKDKISSDKNEAGENNEYWSYYGYFKKLGLHHISKRIYVEKHGFLFNENTGELLDAGEKVVFSPNNKLYYTRDAEDEGDFLKIFNSSGKLYWSGFNYIPVKKNSGIVNIWIEDIQWNKDNELVGVASCISKLKKQAAIVAKDENGWGWKPYINCD